MAGTEDDSSHSDMGDAAGDIFRYYNGDDDLVVDADSNEEFEEGEIILVEHNVDGEVEDNVEEMDLEERFKNKPHPLCISLIVSDVCKYLAVQDLENVRSVNRLWNAEACNILRKTRVIEIIDLDTLIRYNNRMCDTVDFPHTSFHLWTDDISDLEPNINKFFAKFGSHIKSLDFEQLFLDGDHLFEILSNKVPNLESLTLLNLPRRLVPPQNPPVRFINLKSISFVRFPSEGQRPRGFLNDLFAAAPNLEHVSVLKNANGSPLEVEPYPLATFLFNLIVNQPEPLRHLTCLDFHFRLKEEHIEPYTSKLFPLRSLDVSLDSNVKARSFTAFMLALSPTVANISLAFQENSSLAKTLPVAHMIHLVSLTLTNFKGSLLFVEDMPELKHLVLHEIDLGDTLPLRGFRKVDDHRLSSFVSSADASDRDVVARVAWCFPNLSILHLDKLGDEGLGVIYRELPFISELFLTNGTFTDSGISGVPAEVCNDLWETMTIFDVVPERFRRDLFIGSLPHLRKARLESPLMTDLAIMFGLIGCSKLNCLYLKSAKITDISMPAIGEKMRDNLNLIDVIHCPEISEAGKYILKQKLQGRRLIFEAPSSTARRCRRMRTSDIQDREFERAGAQRERLVELARAREIELRVAYRIFNQLNDLEGQIPQNVPGRRHQIIRHFLRRNPHGLREQGQGLNRPLAAADIAHLMDVVHIDMENIDLHMDEVDLNDNAVHAAAGGINPAAQQELGYIPLAVMMVDGVGEEVAGAHGGMEEDHPPNGNIVRARNELVEFIQEIQNNIDLGADVQRGFFAEEEDDEILDNHDLGIENAELFAFLPPYIGPNIQPLREPANEVPGGIPPTPPPFL